MLKLVMAHLRSRSMMVTTKALVDRRGWLCIKRDLTQPPAVGRTEACKFVIVSGTGCSAAARSERIQEPGSGRRMIVGSSVEAIRGNSARAARPISGIAAHIFSPTPFHRTQGARRQARWGPKPPSNNSSDLPVSDAYLEGTVLHSIRWPLQPVTA